MNRNARRGNESGKLAVKLFSLSILYFAFSVAAQTDGTYDLRHSVIAGGGGSSTSTGGVYNVSGTLGQAAAGTSSNGGTFDLHGGFWFQTLAPTAAAVSIAGRVTSADGRGIRNLRLTLTAPDGAIRRATTSTFGYYAFDGVEVGRTYILEITAKRYTFSNPTRVFMLQDALTDIDFVALP